MSIPSYRMRPEDQKDIAALKKAHQDPADLEKRVKENAEWWERQKAGKNPAYEVKR